MEYRHETAGGKTTEEVRQTFYSGVPCELLTRITEIFQEDMDMFDYDADPFFDVCVPY